MFLSQSQIDALFKIHECGVAQEKKTESVQPLSPEEKNYIKYDFFPEEIHKRKNEILRSVFENYAVYSYFPDQRYFPRDDGHNGAGCTGKKVLRIRKCPSRKRLHDNDRRINSRRRKMSVPLMLFVTPGMVITLINHMLGGEDVVAVEDDYRYSDVERALYKRIVEYMTGTLKDGFSNYVSIVFP